MKPDIKNKNNNIEISIIMPCKNEKNTVGRCVLTAKRFLVKNGLSGEVIVVDNGSTDGSGIIAKNSGAKVFKEIRPGYGRAIRTGIKAAKGKILIIGDADLTYDFNESYKIYKMLSSGGYDIVIGDRFKGGIEKGAMPMSHIIGVKFLSLAARKKFKTDVRDFHSGLRGITKDVSKRLKFRTTGMEFATEMIAEAAHNGLSIGQVPVRLMKCRYDRKSKLHTIRDGLRHLRYILNYKISCK